MTDLLSHLIHLLLILIQPHEIISSTIIRFHKGGNVNIESFLSLLGQDPTTLVPLISPLVWVAASSS